MSPRRPIDDERTPDEPSAEDGPAPAPAYGTGGEGTIIGGRSLTDREELRTQAEETAPPLRGGASARLHRAVSPKRTSPSGVPRFALPDPNETRSPTLEPDSSRPYFEAPDVDPDEDDAEVSSASVSAVGEPPTTDMVAPERTSHRYRVLDVIGTGASAVVRRGRDRALHRVVAVKTLKPELAERPGMVARFVREARIVAQLEHPAIVPVHDMGQLPDGRWYITMKEVHGSTLRQLVKALHKARGDGPFVPLDDGWTLRRVIDAFRTVCSALGFAHARGVIHRDVKPDNIMVGAYGEVLLVDWGLAKVIGEPDAPASKEDEQEETDDDSSSGSSWLGDKATRTRHGVVVGTPAFMAPEQARADTARIGVRSDIWSLGGVLFNILYGRPPFQGRSKDVLRRVVKGPPHPVEGVPVPDPLVDIWRKAMSLEPEDRYPDCNALIADIDAWVEGSRARAKAQQKVDQARRRVPELREAQTEFYAVRDRARAAVRALRNTDSLATKEAAWALEQEAERLQDRVESLYLEIATRARLALTEVPGLSEARRLLAEVYRERAEDAERQGDRKGAREYRALLAEHDDGRHAEYLRSDTLVAVETDPPGAQVVIHQVRTHARRLVTRRYAQTGPTPLRGLRLPVGMYLLQLSMPGRDAVRYPIELRRGEAWNPVAPGTTQPTPVRLPPAGSLEGADRLVPAGWFWFGGDADAVGSFPRQRLWVDDFVIQMGPVSNNEYLAFLNDLVRHGRKDIAERYLPRLQQGTGTSWLPLFRWDQRAGRWMVPDRVAGMQLSGESPVVAVTWHDAQSYSYWLRMKSGLPWRLPSEAEREKAARGVDGRIYPWGNYADPSFHCMQDSPIGADGPPPVSVYPIDSSPYGVMGLAGGVMEWCADEFRPMGPPQRGSRPLVPGPPTKTELAPNPRGPRRAVRGGSWESDARACRAASRQGVRPTRRSAHIGFRVCRSLDDDAQSDDGSNR